MLLLFCLVGSVLPNETMSLPLRRSSPRPGPNPVPSLARPNLPRPVPSSPLSLRRYTPTFPRSTPVSSFPTAKTTIPTPSEKKVEQFAQKLRDDMEKQERVLHTFIATLQKKHTSVEMNLKQVRGILSGLRLEIANATRVADRYQGEERTQAATANLVNGEYTKSRKMYEDEKQNLKFEKEFLDAIIKYIKLRKC